MSERRLTEDFRERKFDEWTPSNAYSATGWCPNCHEEKSLLVKKGVPLRAVEMKCRDCEVANLSVRP